MKTPNADHYRGKHNGRDGFPLVAFDAQGYTSIEPLPFLHGRPWDDIALGYIHALRPSRLRVATESVQLDAQNWRVTVWLDADGKTIKKISQEVAVGLPEGIDNGHELEMAVHNEVPPPASALRPRTLSTFCTSDEYRKAIAEILAASPEAVRELIKDSPIPIATPDDQAINTSPFSTVSLPDGVVIGGPWPSTIITWPNGNSRPATKPEYDLFQALEKAQQQQIASLRS